MSNVYSALGEPLAQDADEMGFRQRASQHVGKICFSAGFLFALLLSGVAWPDAAAEDPIDLVAMPSKAMQSLRSGPASSGLFASLPGPSSLKNLVAREIEASSRGCRVVSANAETAITQRSILDTPGEGGKPMYRLMAADLTEPAKLEKVKEMAGVTGPLGLFDPLGISTKVPEGQLFFYREAELKHGRVCMLAVLGLIVGERHDFIPILGANIDPKLPAYLFGTPFASETPIASFWPIALGGLFFEEARRASFKKENPEMMPGDYGWDPLGLKPKDAKVLRELQNKELNNGRLAMFAAAGIIAQEMLTGDKILQPLASIGKR